MQTEDGATRWGTVDLALHGDGVGQRLMRFADWLMGECMNYALREIWCEQVWIDRNTHQQTARVLFGIQSLAEMKAARNSLGFHLVKPTEWRRHFLGPLPRGTRRRDFKRLACERCRVLGYDIKTDDEADALGILDYALARAKVASLTGAGPLFVDGAR